MIYLLEDDESIRSFVEYALNNSGLESKGFEKPSDFWKGIGEEIPSLVILDVMLPEEDGLEVLKKLRNRSETKKVPVIMLTAKDSEYDKVIGLDSGADDYVSKPFGMMELISRIKALLRRTAEETKKDEYTVGGLYVCPSKHIVRANGNDVVLTYKEFELLCYMMRNCDIVLSRTRLMENVWGFDFEGESRTVDMHIKTLRQKLGECGELIRTVRGVGYKLSAEGAPAK